MAMARGPTQDALRQIRTLFELGTIGGLTDTQLLELFLTRSGEGGDAEAEAAFAALVHRHGPMVLGVCRRMLADAHDAEDAFQATFLILARRAAAIGRRERLANWLHGVAVRTAKEARRRSARRKARERRAMDNVKRESESEPAGDWDDLLPILDEEMSRLPERYRAALVACELEGKSRSEAAQQLGIPEGTLSAHLARGRKLLRDRLVRRGASLGAGPLAALLPRGAAEAAVPERLLSAAVHAALGHASGGVAMGTVSASVTTLAEGVLKMMVLTRLTVLVAAMVSLGAASVGAYAAWAAITPGPAEPPGAPVAATADDPAPGDRTEPGIAPRRARVHGLVVDEAGKPVPGIEVRVVNHNDHRSRGITNTAGRFDFAIRSPLLSFTTLLAGSTDRRRQGFHRYDYELMETETKQPIRIVLGPSREVVVLVTDPARAPVPGAAVEVVANYATVAAGSTNDQGTTSLRIPADAPVQWILALKPGRGFDYFEHGTSERGAPGKDLPGTVALVLDGARTARVRALDSAGKPLARIGFAPWYLQKPGKRAFANIGGAEAVRVDTDGRGVATFDWLPATTSPVTFFPRTEGYHAPSRARLEENATTATTLTVRLLRDETIGGRVIGADGKPAAGILVLAQGCGPGPDNGHGRARTAADGSFEMTVNANQSYVVTVSDDDWAAASHIGVIVREGRPVEGLDFHLERGTLIRGTVTIGPAQKPTKGRSVWLHQSGGELPRELRENDRFYHEVAMDRYATTDANGRYRLRVAPGSYSLGIPGQIQQETITVKNEQGLIRDFGMPRSERGPISGRVVIGESGRGVSGAKIEGVIAEPLGGLDLVIVADAEGRFRADRELKKMVVHARSPDGSLGGIVEISGDDAEIEIPIGPTTTASGIILDERGEPVANVLLQWGRRVYQGDEEGPFRDAFGPKVTTDEEGRFVLPELVVGQEYRIGVPRGNETWSQVGTVLPSEAIAIDLGTLRLVANGGNVDALAFRAGSPAPGDPAPDFRAGARSHGARTLDGRPLKLEDFRGKFVLLDFWATWCGPCLSEIPRLQEVHEAFGRDPRFVILSLSVDETIDAPRRFQAKRKLPWMQGFVGQGIGGAIPDSYGVRAIPALVLIGPDGKIVAKGMRGGAISQTIDQALGQL